MRVWTRVGLIAGAGVAIAAAVSAWAFLPGKAPTNAKASAESHALDGRLKAGAPPIPLFTAGFVDDSGWDLALSFTPPIPDRSSLTAVRNAAGQRVERGLRELRSRLAKIDALPADAPARGLNRHRMQMMIGLLFMYQGEFSQATAWFEKSLAENGELPAELRANTEALLGIAALRQGEVDNCVACLGPSSCIFPIARDAVHQRTEGSREAVRRFTAYLSQRPDDLGIRWLLNVAYMTLGEYPAQVPPQYLIGLASFESTSSLPHLDNIAPLVGLDTRGPNMLGGSVFDDFTGDGLPDVVVGSTDWDLGTSLYVNQGDGTFVDRGVAAGLADQAMASNVSHADFDNDGRLDLLLLRGGWETPYRLSLLRNQGDGTFEDVTVASGLAQPIASQSCAWGDFDNDGLIDVYVVGEYQERFHDSSNLCRLYNNKGDGTFENVAGRAGVENARWAKGATFGDYDGDGWLDLYVSNMHGPNRLYHNNGDGTFTDKAHELGVDQQANSFSCWFWDYDNDGRLDLFVCGFYAWLNDVIADSLGQPTTAERPRLYRNLGLEGFRDVTNEVGLNRVLLPMGSNFGDLDSDGFLDVYLGTGRPPYSHLVPNVMFRNVEGRRFADVTLATGTGHLQKGHGVSFADWDCDGDLDMFVEMGGSTPGDRAHNVLFQNPGTNAHWLKVKLIGTKTNRAAIGAQIRADLVDSNGKTRSLYRTISGGSSFGGNCLVAFLGLGEANSVAKLTVTWPVSRTKQTFENVAARQFIEITEGAESFRTIEQRPIPILQKP